MCARALALVEVVTAFGECLAPRRVSPLEDVGVCEVHRDRTWQVWPGRSGCVWWPTKPG